MKLGIVLPGQGEIPTAATIALWREDNRASKVWVEAEQILGEPLREWLDQGKSGDTRKAQILSVVGSLASYAAYEAIVGIKPDVLMGHSVGEIAAVSIACRLGLDATLRIVETRGRVMQDVIDSSDSMGMFAVIDPPADIEERLADSDEVFVANFNSESQVVISGYVGAIKSFVETRQLRAIPLDVAGAFHTPLMAQAAAQFRVEIDPVLADLTAGSIVIANRTALPFDFTDAVAEFADQITSPVRWAASMRWSFAHGVQRVVDLSSTGMLARMSKIDKCTFSAGGTLQGLTDTRHELRHLVAVEQGYDLAARSLGKIVSTKNSNPDPEVYREIVIPGYQKIRALVGQTDADPSQILALVDEILTVKCVDDDTRREAIQNLRWHADLELSAE